MARRLRVLGSIVLALGVFSCGGGGGGGGDGGSSANRTTFTGNVSDAGVAATQAQAGPVQVCVENTSFCTFVDEDGVFTLAADVGGDVTLVFTGADFVARVTLTGIPRGATVRLHNIRCSTITGLCEPEDFEIEGGAETRSAIRCEHGPVHVVSDGELVIAGDGEDCIRAEGQCGLTIEADHIVLDGCESCVRAAGGSDVTLIAGPGGIECHAREDGISAAGNSAVHVDTDGGDLVIDAGEVGVLSVGTSSVDITGDQCHIAGDESGLTTHGNATIDTEGCNVVDLVGGTNHGGDADDDQGEDDGDQGEDRHD